MRTFADRTRSRHGLGVDTATVWPGHGQRLVAATVEARTRTVFGLNAVADWTRLRPAGRSAARIYRVQTGTTSQTQNPRFDEG